MRIRRVLAVASRDLFMELGGRRGWSLLALTAALLVPSAAIPLPEAATTTTLRVTGDVPAEVAAHGSVEVVESGASVYFEARSDGLRVHATRIPPEIRDGLDGTAPSVRRRDHPPPPLPGRSLWFALVSASLLSGALAESLPGERERRTLEALLTAGITRGELVVGKWAAWAGYGSAAALGASGIAIVSGRVSAGPWLIAVPCVAATAVALGLYLVRHAEDALSGSLLALRALPAILATTALASWAIGTRFPVLAACVPVGGALVVSGATYAGMAPAALALAVSAASSGALLRATSRDLEEPPRGRPSTGPILWAAASVALAAPLLGPYAWTRAGNPTIAPSIPESATARAILSALLCLGLVFAAASGRGERHVRTAN